MKVKNKCDVRFFPFQAHCFAFGGFDIQMIKVQKSINDLHCGCEVSSINLWDRDNTFKIAHFWGLDISHYNQIYWAKKCGKKVVLTALLSYFENIDECIRHKVSSYVGIVRILKKIILAIDALVVVNEEQKKIAITKYSCDPQKIFIIPHQVENRFYNKNIIKHNFCDYVISIGNICKRKNQLKLAIASIQANVKLVLVGEVLDGQDEYGHQLENLISTSPNITWLKGLESASSELIELIQNSKCVALLSDQETQPISLLEAAVLQKPLLISNRKFAHQIYYQNACLVDERNIDSIVNGIKLVSSNPLKYIPDKSELQACKPEVVGDAYIKLYKSLIVD